MNPFHRWAGLAQAAVAAVVIAAGLTAAPATASPPRATTQTRAGSWTVIPGGVITGSSGVAVLGDTRTNAVIQCVSSAMAGSLKPGSGLSGTGIGVVTSLTFSTCTGPPGLTFTVRTSASGSSPWLLNAVSYDAATGVTTGTITNIRITLSSSTCDAAMAGTTASAPGQVNVTYANSKHTLMSGNSDLHIWNVSGCLGLFSNGDAACSGVSYTISPPQTISSPLPGSRPGTRGTGPPCR